MKLMKKRKMLNTKGQSILEFLLFMPLMFILFLTTVTIIGSINGSINQQKSLRSYYFFRTKSNGKTPPVQDIEGFAGSGVQTIGVHVLGWMDYSIGKHAVASCYSLQSLVTTQADDTCENSDTVQGRGAKSKFIRSYTAYGICSAYILSLKQKDDYSDISSMAWSSGYCTRQ